jgi:hypothetical protein
MIDVSTGQPQNRRAAAGVISNLGASPPGDCRPGSQSFNTAWLATTAARPAIIDAHMPAFACRAGATVIDLPVEDDAGANARANNSKEHISMTASRAPKRFGQGGGIGIVIHFYGHSVDS